MERKISSAQMNALLLENAKEDRLFPQELTGALKSSIQICFCFKNMSKSMAQIGTINNYK